MISAIVLAAGLSRRMGKSKLLLAYGGTTVLRHATEHVLDAGIHDVVVVVGPEHGATARALEGLPVRLAVNPTPEAGQGASVGAGGRSPAPGTTAGLLAPRGPPALPSGGLPAPLEAIKGPGEAVARAP